MVRFGCPGRLGEWPAHRRQPRPPPSQDSITRAEMAAVLNRAFGTYKTTSIQRFRDVKSTDWFYKDLQMAYHMVL